MAVRLVSKNVDSVKPGQLAPERTDAVRVLFLCPDFLGFGTYSHSYLRHYAEIRDDVDAVFVDMEAPLWLKVLGKAIPGLIHNGWDFHSTRYLHLWQPVMRRWLTGPLDLKHFDVVHILTQGVALVMRDFTDRDDVKWAVNIDSTGILEVEEYGFSPTARKPFIRAERKIFDQADLIVGRNRWCTESLEADYGVGDDRVIVAANSIKPADLEIEPDPMPRGDLKRIVMVGNNFVRKGGPQLIDAHQRLFADRAELHIFSREPERSGRNVFWHSGVGREELLSRWLPSMDVFCLWTWFDMHPWAVLEALSVGLPVVSSRLAGIPDMVIHEQTGLLCTPRDWPAYEAALGRLLDDDALRLQLGANAREHVRQNYNADRNFNALFDRLVGLAG